MKSIFLLAITLFMFSCGNKKAVQLPEIGHSEITEINDVSAAYLFYDETQPDSVELNRKNLISTTNWLINVDKRLTLKQVIPHIKFLQEKKQNAGHKNVNAKNYFTCHDTSRNSLGFVEFTDVTFKNNIVNSTRKDFSLVTFNCLVKLYSLERIELETTSLDSVVIENYKRIDDLLIELKGLTSSGKLNLKFSFSPNLSFQDYITFKSLFLNAENDSLFVSNNEFIY
ncbi:hypothetical protein [Aestuariivivens insulae]|uniref:hypothetical protein n=1 Tax=Aestuariivivens insulae TaxID=1621988 RepID=UPI001F56B98B|nr:hypothetical protein [Aestuariivivens insulae]